jgi:hypothetical protein
MTKLIEIKVKDQYSNILKVQAKIRSALENSSAATLSLFQRIEHIIVDGEKILPSIELLFESRETTSIYKVVE